MIEPLKTFEAEDDKGEVTERVKAEEVVKKINEIIDHINILEQMHNPENKHTCLNPECHCLQHLR